MEHQTVQSQSAHVETFEAPIDAPEVARILGTTENHIRNMARQGKIPAIKVGVLWRFRKSTLMRWMAQQEEQNCKGA